MCNIVPVYSYTLCHHERKTGNLQLSQTTEIESQPGDMEMESIETVHGTTTLDCFCDRWSLNNEGH